MDNTRTFELKVGAFILIGIAIVFLIVFSIGDINLSKNGYRIKIQFNFASGIGGAAPIRLAGVGVGQVEGIKLIYDEAEKRTKAELVAWINEGTKIENDARVTINTLGLLGEKYLEIYPGTPGAPVLNPGDMIVGRDPVPMEKITEKISNLSDSVSVIVDRLKRGEGTVGKLLTDDKLYNNVVVISDNLVGVTGRLNRGEGTIGKFLTDPSLYDELEGFAADIHKHPWKLLQKPRGE